MHELMTEMRNGSRNHAVFISEDLLKASSSSSPQLPWGLRISPFAWNIITRKKILYCMGEMNTLWDKSVWIFL